MTYIFENFWKLVLKDDTDYDPWFFLIWGGIQYKTFWPRYKIYEIKKKLFYLILYLSEKLGMEVLMKLQTNM